MLLPRQEVVPNPFVDSFDSSSSVNKLLASISADILNPDNMQYGSMENNGLLYSGVSGVKGTGSVLFRTGLP